MTSDGAGVAVGARLEGRSRARLATVVPALRRRAQAVLTIMAEIGHPMVVTDGRRTAAQQAALYAQGRTTPGPIVTWTRRSRHQTGRALDCAFVAADGHGVTWDGPWDRYGLAAEAVGLTWGGRWTTPDRPHVELPAELGDED